MSQSLVATPSVSKSLDPGLPAVLTISFMVSPSEKTSFPAVSARKDIFCWIAEALSAENKGDTSLVATVLSTTILYLPDFLFLGFICLTALSRAIRPQDAMSSLSCRDEDSHQCPLYFSIKCAETALLKEYAPQWTNPSYFDDFFDALSAAIFTAGDWNLFYEVYESIKNYTSDSIRSQFSYLLGRLIQTGHINSSKENMIQAFETAYSYENSIYYSSLAKYQLIKNNVDISKIKNRSSNTQSQEQINFEAGILLEGYATFGFPEKIYKTWSNLENKNIPQDKLIYLCEFLQNCGTYAEEDNYFTQSLRMAQKIQGKSKLKFPKFYSDLIEKYSAQYEIDPTIMYSLIRSESFFDPDVTSVAGANGLSQLMEFTAADIARKLKIKDYSLTDPETNIHFGTYYLKNMISRLGDDYLHGFFAYNAGITRVRRWLNTSILGFGKKSNMPSDLFLETLPYTETREYGRKLVSASVMYKTLYSKNPEKEFTEILELIMDF